MESVYRWYIVYNNITRKHLAILTLQVGTQIKYCILIKKKGKKKLHKNVTIEYGFAALNGLFGYFRYCFHITLSLTLYRREIIPKIKNGVSLNNFCLILFNSFQL